MTNRNVLISSAGRRVSLVRDFRKSLNALFPGAKVLACDAKPELSAACQYADASFAVPRINDPGFVAHLLEHCKLHQIGMIIPTIDTELLLLAEHKADFQSAGIALIVSDFELVQACRNKRRTHDLFLKYGLDHAREVEIDSASLPVFSKPESGSSSIGIHVFNNRAEITPALRMEPGRMFLEYLDPAQHTEFTMDMYYSKNHELRCCVPRQRIEIRSGEVNKGITRKNELYNLLLDKLRFLKGARGCITLQVFRNNQSGRITGIEINPRFGGGYPLSYAAGADFPSMLIREYFNNDSLSLFEAWEANLLMLRYDDEVLVHGASV